MVLELPLRVLGASLVAQLVKNLPAMWETRVRSLGWEDSQGEGNGNPLQYSCLGNLMDRGAWWATIHGVTKSLTRLTHYHFSLLQEMTVPHRGTLKISSHEFKVIVIRMIMCFFSSHFQQLGYRQ